jgi:phosphocarrier protein FPr/phosphocarrier protein
VTIRAGGPQAEDAAAALAELLETGMGELQPLVQVPETTPLAEPLEPAKELRGISAVPGMAQGPAWRLNQNEIAVQEHASDPKAEREALAAARTKVQAALAAEAQGDQAAAAIAEAHLAMIDDPELDEAAQKLIDSGKSAAFAWCEAIRRFAAPLRASKDARLAERLDDLVDLERRVLAELTGEGVEAETPPEGAILIADTLYPSQLKTFAELGISGIATAAGGATSHAAIIAASLGLPMIVGLGPRLLDIDEGTPLILRGDNLSVAAVAGQVERARDVVARRAARR